MSNLPYSCVPTLANETGLLGAMEESLSFRQKEKDEGATLSFGC